MMTSLFILCHGVFVAQQEPPPDSYLIRTFRALELARADVASMQPVVDEAAARLAVGGALWVAGQPSVISELCGRAGGIMLAQRLGDQQPGNNDVVLYAYGEPEYVTPPPSGSGTLVVVFAPKPVEGVRASLLNHAPDTGLSPTHANAVTGWLFTGELVAALTRLGKMPVMYATIGIYDGYPRIARYQQKGIFWHDPNPVAPVQPGVIANAYCDAVGAMLRRVETEERDRLDKAGAWAAEAKSAGKRLIMYSMGHLFPYEVEKTAIGTLFESAVWNSGFFQDTPPDHTYNPGDVLIHIGYQHPPYRLLERARPSGAKVAYVDVMQHRDYTKDPDVLWLDPMWPWVDGCVTLPGYDITILPASGVVNAAIAWDIFRVTQRTLERK